MLAAGSSKFGHYRDAQQRYQENGAECGKCVITAATS
jgi:hypothetical protein